MTVALAPIMPRKFSPVRLKEFRTARGWTETKLAAEADCSPQAIKDLEAGKHEPRAKLLARLADVLGLESIEELFVKVDE